MRNIFPKSGRSIAPGPLVVTAEFDWQITELRIFSSKELVDFLLDHPADFSTYFRKFCSS